MSLNAKPALIGVLMKFN